jgi:predicted translation initiation factor SUI1
MAKVQKVIVFVAADADRAKAAETAFSAAAGRLGLSWSAQSRTHEGLTAEALAGVLVLVAVELPDFTPPGWTGRLEHITSPDLELEVNKLIARLLGGNDQAVVSPPPPPPPAPKKVHTVKLSRETAGRRGKGVTVVSDLPLDEEALKELAAKLKNACGSGGTAKDGRIEIQGDHRDRVASELEKLGYKVKRAGG